ncbi:unnamed protein product [Oikopleura dioica]|uniref:Uncharacterized protein n=1 Tax=Oikopleura dioica TaxID=34765 RepID=E4YCW5_OIKDI|nr:unnamed protein product [Oikopleura dioica]
MAETENTKSAEPVVPRTVQSKDTVEQELTQFLMPQYYFATVQQQQQLLVQQQYLIQQQQQFQMQNQYVDASNLSAFGTELHLYARTC